MGVLDIFKFGKSTQKRGIDEYMTYMTGVGMSGGKTILVTNKKSINLGVVFDCLDVITRTLSLVRPKVFEQRSDGKYIATNHKNYKIINTEPYTLYDASTYYSRMAVFYYLFGNAYAEILQDNSLRIIEPDNVEPYILTENGIENKWYKVSEGKDKVRAIPQSKMIHIMDMSFDGIKGLSRIQTKKATLTQAGQIQNYATDVYQNGNSLSGLLTTDRVIEKDALEYLRKKFEQQVSSKNGGIGALPQGFTYQELKYSLPFADANIIEAGKFAVEEIARIFGVPLSLLMRGESADNKNDRDYNTFLSNVIAPLTIMLENEHNRKLFPENEKGRFYIKFELKGLYRTDMLTRYQAHQIALNHGFMNKDEVRNVEDMNPIPNGLGQTFYQMLNTIPLDKAMDYYDNIIEGNKAKENSNDITGN